MAARGRFGAMDGLVSNIGLIAGVGGGGVAAHAIVLTGTAGLVAGAVSMALGEYTSVRTQTEQVAAEVAKERRELEHNPEAETEELAQMWVERGLPGDLARAGRRGRAPQPRGGAAGARAGGARRRPGRAAQPVDGGVLVVHLLLGRRAHPVAALPVRVDVLWPALVAGGVGLFLAGALCPGSPGRPGGSAGCGSSRSGAAAAGVTYLIGRLIGGGGHQ